MLKGKDTCNRIWNYLIEQGLTSAGAAGLIGNLQAESGLISNRVEILCLKRLREAGKNYTDKSYTTAVDSGKISRDKFLYPLPGRQYGYGLAQWTSPSRKAGLYDLCKRRGVSIADLETQLIWLMSELTATYKSVLQVLRTTGSVETAANAVLTKFECPSDCGAGVKAYRAELAWQAYKYNKEIGVGNMELRQRVVDLANSQGTNAGGKKYWSWWGYTNRVPWCQIWVSWIMEQCGVPLAVYGKYENCQYAISQMKSKGIWHARGYRPQVGDICYYDWQQDGTSDHVGIVVAVSGDQVTVREGNKSDAVGNRVMIYNDRQIVGYASPKYDTGEEQGSTQAPGSGTGSTNAEGGKFMFEVGLVKQGSKGNDVKLLQWLLKSNGHKGADGKALTIDGDAGANTVYAIKAYQGKHGLSVDGVAGPATWKSILLR